MQKILIADDEAPIREWLGFCLEKAGYSCTITGMASNGEEALSMFRSNQPDVLITDIRMPVMDGLALIEKVRQLAPEVGIIVLSSHDDFSYVRTAMKAGACEYILKTEITDSLLVDILAKLGSGKQKGPTTDSGRLVPKRIILLKRLLSPALDAAIPGDAELKECEVFLSDTSIFAAALRFDEAAGIPADLAGSSNPLFAFANRISSPVWFPNDLNTAILAANLSEALSPVTRSRILKDFIVGLAAHFHASVGASRIYPGTAFLGQAMREALLSLTLDFYTGPGSWNRADAHDSVESVSGLEGYRNGMLEPLIAGNSVAALTKLEEISDYLAEARPLPISGVKSFFQELLEAIMNYQERTGIDKSRMRTTLEEANSLDELTKAFRNEIRGTDRLGEGGKYSRSVRKALAHAAANSLKNMDLNELASISGLNPDYFSRIFKEETGMNFVSWLSDLKIKRAISLLRETNMKVYEIADEIGYSNLGYFSKVFKKQTGLNPFEFRNSPQ